MKCHFFVFLFSTTRKYDTVNSNNNNQNKIYQKIFVKDKIQTEETKTDKIPIIKKVL